MNKIFLIAILFLINVNVNSQNIRVLTYNIRYDNPSDGLNSWNNRKQKLVEQIKNFDCDVISIQEGLIQQVDYLKNQLSEYNFYGIGRDDGQTKGEYSGIFYRKTKYIIKDSGTFWLSPTPSLPSKGWDAALNRICSYVKLFDNQTQKNIWIFNTHFDHIGNKARIESSKLIINKISKLVKIDECSVLCGDFNSTKNDTAIIELCKAFSDSGKKAINHLGHQQSSFNGFGSKDAIQQQIDFIFYDERKLTAQIFLIGNEKISENQYYSDHFPVLCEFSFIK